MKFIQVELSNGARYTVPKQVVIERLALKRSQKALQQIEVEHTEMYAQLLKEAQQLDETVLLRVAGAELYWKLDIEPYAVRIRKPEKVDFVTEWTNGEKAIVEL